MINEIQPKMKFQNIVQCPFKFNPFLIDFILIRIYLDSLRILKEEQLNGRV